MCIALAYLHVEFFKPTKRGKIDLFSGILATRGSNSFTHLTMSEVAKKINFFSNSVKKYFNISLAEFNELVGSSSTSGSSSSIRLSWACIRWLPCLQQRRRLGIQSAHDSLAFAPSRTAFFR